MQFYRDQYDNASRRFFMDILVTFGLYANCTIRLPRKSGAMFAGIHSSIHATPANSMEPAALWAYQ